ncbi:hypothetical protein EV06_1098 [Prochlorococcus sp. MIT 0602]|nr:hypothetical protein EV06_1098 [Prochlorococcus sp. MIT 0602]KGG17504.1 hypothetical protein EV07_0944 [Prochlorococcus sp. MIT 0603]
MPTGIQNSEPLKYRLNKYLRTNIWLNKINNIEKRFSDISKILIKVRKSFV